MKSAQRFLTITMNKIADYTGRPALFAAVVAILLTWLLARRFMPHDLWFDIMDAVIFVTTFLMVFILQVSQNADTKAMQDKLDAIIEALPEAEDSLRGEEKEIKHGNKEVK